MVIDNALINALGFSATVLSILMWIPQARSTWQHRNDPVRLAAISETTQWLLMACYLLWGVFGLASQSFWVAAPSVVAFPLALATVVIVRRGRRLPSAIGTVAIIGTAEMIPVAPVTASHQIFSAERGATADVRTRDAFTATGAIPILA